MATSLEELRKKLYGDRGADKPSDPLEQLRDKLYGQYRHTYPDPTQVGPPEAPQEPTGRTLGEFASDLYERGEASFEEGAATALELPVNLANTINTYANPIAWAWQAIDPSVNTQLQQPAAIAGTAEQIRINALTDLNASLSKVGLAHKQKLAEIMAPKEGRGFFGEMRDLAGFFAQNPSALAEEGFSLIGQVLSPGGFVPGAKQATVLAQALQAGGMNASQVREELIKQGASPEEAQQAATQAFAMSTGVNTILPNITPGGAAVESLLSGQIGKQATRGLAGRTIGRATAGELVAEGGAEGLDAMIQNLATGKPLMEGVGGATFLGSVLGAPMGTAAGTADYLAGRKLSEQIRKKDEESKPKTIEEQITKVIEADREVARQPDLFNFDTPRPGPDAKPGEQDAIIPEPTRAEKATMRSRLEDIQNRQQIVDDALAADRERLERSRLAEEQGEDVEGLALRRAELEQEQEEARLQAGALESQLVTQGELPLNDPFAADKARVQQKLEKARQAEASAKAKQEEKAREQFNKRERLGIKMHMSARSGAEKAALKRARETFGDDTDSDAKIAEQVVMYMRKWDSHNPITKFTALAHKEINKPAPTAKATKKAAPTVAERAAARKAKISKLEGRSSNVTPFLPNQEIREAPNDNTVTVERPDLFADGVRLDPNLRGLDSQGRPRPFKDIFVPDEVMRGDKSANEPRLRTRDEVRAKISPKLRRRVRVVQSVDSLPDAGNLSATSKGYFDGKDIWLVADNLPEGEENATILHEVKHYYDQLANEGKGPKSRSMKAILGDEANNKLAEKITNMGDNEIVRAAMLRARKAAGNDTQLFNEEVITYFLEEADLARQNGKPLGRAAGIVKDILAAIRTFLRDKGIPLGISLNDLYFLGRQLGQRFSEETETPSGNVGKSTMIGRKAKTFEEEKFKNPALSDVGPVDMLDRQEIDDSEARIVHESSRENDDEISEELFNELADEHLRGSLNQLLDGHRVPLTEFFHHEGLERAYPLLMSKLNVYTGPEDAPYGGRAHTATREIEVNESIVSSVENRMDQKSKDNLISILLHEIQHFIQAYEGFVFGGTPEDFIDPESHIPPKDVRKRLEDFVDLLDVEKLEEAASTILDIQDFDDARVSADNMAEGPGKEVLHNEYKKQLLSRVLAKVKGDVENIPDATLRSRARAFDKLMKQYTISLGEKREANRKYMHIAGEAEARAVEARMKMSIEERLKESFYETLLKQEKNLSLDKLFDPEKDENVAQNRSKRRASGRSSAARVQPKPKLDGVPNMMLTERQARKGVFSKKQEFTIRNRVGTWFQKVLRSGGAMPLELVESQTNASGLAQSLGMQAVHAKRELDHAVETHPSREQVRTLLNRIGKADAEERGGLLQELRSEAPAVYAEYVAARALIRKYSLQIVKSLEAQGIELDEKTENVVDKIIRSIENDDYTTRSYKLNAPRGEGRKWATRMARAAGLTAFGQWSGEIRRGINEMSRKLGWDAYGKRLDQDAKLAAVVANAIEFLKHNDLHIPDDLDTWDPGEITLKDRERLINLHQQYVGETNYEILGTDRIIDDLIMAKKNITEEDVTARAEAIIPQILGLTDPRKVSRIAKAYNSARQDLTIITPKENLPPEIRALLGEYEDEAHNLFATLVRQGEFLARQNMLNEFAQIGVDKWFFTSKNRNPKIHTVQLDGPTFGPLRNMWVTKEVADWLDSEQERRLYFQDILNSFNLGSEFVNPIDQTLRYLYDTTIPLAARLNKGYTVVWNLAGTAFNLIGSPFLLAKDGNYNGKAIANGANVSRKLIGLVRNRTLAKNPELKDEILNAIHRQLIDSVQVGELQKVEVEQLLRELSPSNPLISGARTLNAYVTDFFAISDAWTKLANYYAQVDFLTSLHKAAGTSITEDLKESIARTAGERVRRTNMTYLRAPSGVKWFEKKGLAMFGLYMWESWRSTLASYQLAAEDLQRAKETNNPKVAALIRKHAMTRIGGTIAATAFNSAITGALGGLISLIVSGVTGDDPEDDEKLKAAMQYGVPPYMRGKQLWHLGKDTDGKHVFFDLGRMDPIGPLNDVGRNLLNYAMSGGEEVYMDTALKNFTDMWIVNTVWAKTLLPILTREAREPSFAQDFPEWHALLKTNMVNTSFGLMDPTTADGILRATEAFTPKLVTTMFGTGLSMWEGLDEPGHFDMTKAMGLKAVKYDPVESAKGTAKYVYVGPVLERRNEIKNYVYTMGDSGSEQALEDLYTQALETELQVFSESVPTINAAKMNGATRTQLLKAMREGGMNERQATAVYRGKFQFTVLSEDAVDAWMKEELLDAGKDPLKRGEVRQKYRHLRQVFRELDSKYKKLTEE